jgi:salicylate hydroxylase
VIDGTHSAVAPAVVPAPEPVFARLCAYRCLVPAEAAPDFARRPVQTLWIGPGRHVVHYPISGSTLINDVAYVPETDWVVESWSAEGRVEDVAAEFATWDPRLGSLIEASPSDPGVRIHPGRGVRCWRPGRRSAHGASGERGRCA